MAKRGELAPVEVRHHRQTPGVTYQREHVRCGKPGCSKLHGPYWYAYWKVGGRVRKRYVGRHFRPIEWGDDDLQRHAVLSAVPAQLGSGLRRGKEKMNYVTKCSFCDARVRVAFDLALPPSARLPKGWAIVLQQKALRGPADLFYLCPEHNKQVANAWPLP